MVALSSLLCPVYRSQGEGERHAEFSLLWGLLLQQADAGTEGEDWLV